MVIIRGINQASALLLPPTPLLVERLALKRGIDRHTTTPISFDAVSKKIGESPAFLMLSMLHNPNCSKEGIESAIEVMSGITGKDYLSVKELDLTMGGTRLLGFKLNTEGFLKDDFENNGRFKCSFHIAPEVRYKKGMIKDGAKGVYTLDMEITMFLTLIIPDRRPEKPPFKIIDVASVVVEFDGPSHLNDEAVRSDKERDSLIQSMGKTVFRIQTPYKHKGEGSGKAYKDALDDVLKNHIQNIKEHFRVVMYRLIETLRGYDRMLNIEALDDLSEQPKK